MQFLSSGALKGSKNPNPKQVLTNVTNPKLTNSTLCRSIPAASFLHPVSPHLSQSPQHEAWDISKGPLSLIEVVGTVACPRTEHSVAIINRSDSAAGAPAAETARTFDKIGKNKYLDPCPLRTLPHTDNGRSNKTSYGSCPLFEF